MTTLHTLILGLLQGLTEFLPVSSSAHLTFGQALLKTPEAGRLAVDVLLHVGTAFALLVYFARRLGRIIAGLFGSRPDTRRENGRLVLMIMAGSVPAAIAGLLAQEHLETFFIDPLYSAVFLLVTGIILFLTRRARGERAQVTWRDALLIGTAQAIAILPGISRSGSTIAAALFLGLAGAAAFEFSFLLSIPAVLGAAVLEFKDTTLFQSGAMPLSSVIVGLLAAFASGLFALYLVNKALLNRWFHWFAPYCWAVGLLALFLRLF